MEIKERKEDRYQIIFDVFEDHNISLDMYEKDMVINLIRGLDYIDQIQDLRPTENFYEETLKFISGEIEINEDIPKNVRMVLKSLCVYILKTNQKERLKSYARSLFKRRIFRCTTKSIEEYVEYSIKEADSYSRVFFLFLPKEKMTENLKEVFIYGQRVGRVFDNLIDLKEDYQNHQIGFKPNWKLKIVLWIEMLYWVFQLISIYPKKIKGLKIVKIYIKRYFVKRYFVPTIWA